MFRKYEKIHRLGKDETEGILLGKCYVQEKVDGANTSIWLEDGVVKCGSRSRELTGGFNGFVEYVKTHGGIERLLCDHPGSVLYGEWLVRHSISYNETAYRHFYLFDIYDGKKYLDTKYVNDIAVFYGIPHPQIFGVFDNPTEEDIKKFAGQSNLGTVGEGVVIKNPDFVDKFGNRSLAKIVTEHFKEENGLIFGGNNKHSDTYWEMYVVNKYMTLPRVEKVMHKIQPLIEEKLDMKHIPRIMGTCWHDMITEEIFEITKKVPILDITKLKRLCDRKSKQIFVDIITNNISVADRQN